jgi:hypothetical protein
MEELAMIAANRGDLAGAINYQQQLVILTSKKAKRRQQARPRAYAYQGLGKFLARNGELKSAEEAFLESLFVWQRLADTNPDDVAVITGLAGIHADLAIVQKQIHNAAGNDKEVDARYLDRSCRSFYASVELLNKLPGTKVGFGARLFGLPSSTEFRSMFAGMCRNSY